MTTQNQSIELRDCRILRDILLHEIPNAKVLAAVQMKAGRDTREQQIVGMICKQLDSPRMKSEPNLQWSPM